MVLLGLRGRTETLATFIYRAHYVDKKRNYGNFGHPVACTVSV